MITPKDKALAITKGEVSEHAGFLTTRDAEGDLVIIAGMIRHGKRGFAEVNSSPFGGFQDGFTYATKEENVANATLYADAHNTYNSCQMLPSQMLEKLREAEQWIISYLKDYGWPGNPEASEKMREFMQSLQQP